ncbi:MAG: hypothetical protein QNJ84_15200 [Alphaproteobacteria bacterium]|nr:hypothetical protein [Alphaproteobacteria bacterium]
MVYTLASVEEEKLSEIRTLEREIGAPLIAMSELAVQPARLDRDKLARIEALEKKLGVVLVAVDAA